MQENKAGTVIGTLLWAVLLAGVIIFLIGTYYAVFRAGIPYQDPPPELQIKYAVNMGIGEGLIKTGALTAVAGVLGLIVKTIIKKFKKQ